MELRSRVILAATVSALLLGVPFAASADDRVSAQIVNRSDRFDSDHKKGGGKGDDGPRGNGPRGDDKGWDGPGGDAGKGPRRQVPEPASLALALTGLAAVAFVVRRRGKRA